jgi:hypothetical protein
LAVGDNVPGDIEDWVPADRKAGLNVEELAEENDFQDVARKALRAVSCLKWRMEYKTEE